MRPNERVTMSRISEVSGSVSVGEVPAAFESLASQIETHERKLSKEDHRFEDL